MSSGEKVTAVVLVLVLIGLAVYWFGFKPEGKAMPPGMGGAGAAAFGETETMGPEDAKLKIVGLVPIANPCHAGTVAALREVYEAHPKEIHLTLIDFHGPDSAQWQGKLGVKCATVEINGKYAFELAGRKVIFQQQEGVMYQPTDVKTVVEEELAKL